jgi:hypothetical protein
MGAAHPQNALAACGQGEGRQRSRGFGGEAPDEKSRVGCLDFKPTEIVNAVVNPFLGPPEPHLLRLPALLGAA